MEGKEHFTFLIIFKKYVMWGKCYLKLQLLLSRVNDVHLEMLLHSTRRDLMGLEMKRWARS